MRSPPVTHHRPRVRGITSSRGSMADPPTSTTPYSYAPTTTESWNQTTAYLPNSSGKSTLIRKRCCPGSPHPDMSTPTAGPGNTTATDSDTSTSPPTPRHHPARNHRHHPARSHRHHYVPTRRDHSAPTWSSRHAQCRNQQQQRGPGSRCGNSPRRTTRPGGSIAHQTPTLGKVSGVSSNKPVPPAMRNPPSRTRGIPMTDPCLACEALRDDARSFRVHLTTQPAQGGHPSGACGQVSAKGGHPGC